MSKSRGTERAFPCVTDRFLQEGITIREHYASLAMQALASNQSWGKSECDPYPIDWNEYLDNLTSASVQIADSLIRKLE